MKCRETDRAFKEGAQWAGKQMWGSGKALEEKLDEMEE